MSKDKHAIPATPVAPQHHSVEEVGFNIIYYRLLCAAAGIRLGAEKRMTPRLEAKFYFEIGLCSNILDNLFGFTKSYIAEQEALIKAKEEMFENDVTEFINTIAPKEDKKLIVTDNLGGEFKALTQADALLRKKG